MVDVFDLFRQIRVRASIDVCGGFSRTEPIHFYCLANTCFDGQSIISHGLRERAEEKEANKMENE